MRASESSRSIFSVSLVPAIVSSPILSRTPARRGVAGLVKQLDAVRGQSAWVDDYVVFEFVIYCRPGAQPVVLRGPWPRVRADLRRCFPITYRMEAVSEDASPEEAAESLTVKYLCRTRVLEESDGPEAVTRKGVP